MTIELTRAQVEKMAKLAILASKPMGMGFLHFNSDLKESDIILRDDDIFINIDYYQGRMVKFYARSVTPGVWGFQDEISDDYQSWKPTYDSYQVLADSVK